MSTSRSAYIWDDEGMPANSLYLTRRETDFICAHIPAVRSGLALDIGCGTGKYIRLLEKLGYKSVGLEYAATPLQILKKRQPESLLLQADGACLPFGENTFDAVISIQVQDYFDDVRHFYREVRRVLKPGGLAVVTMTNKASLKGLIYETYLRCIGRPRSAHFYEHKLGYFLDAVRDCGLSVTSLFGYGFNILPRQCDVHWLVDAFSNLEDLLRLGKMPSICPYACVLMKKNI